MVVGDNESTATKNAGKSLAISIAMAMQRYNAGHRPMEHIQGFTRSHWMPPSVFRAFRERRTSQGSSLGGAHLP
jgi:hypothetical protein